MNNSISDQDKAYHEAGHALISYLCKEPVSKLNIGVDSYVAYAKTYPTNAEGKYEVTAFEAVLRVFPSWGAYFSQCILRCNETCGIDWISFNASSLDMLTGLSLLQEVFSNMTDGPEYINVAHTMWCYVGRQVEYILNLPEIREINIQLAEHLLQKREMTGDELAAFLSNRVNQQDVYNIIEQNINTNFERINEYYGSDD